MFNSHRFWKKVRRSSSCWEWTGTMFTNGYGKVVIGGRQLKAHRVAFFLLSGTWPENVCHKCDNPKCVRPSHLFGGSATDNVRDMVKKQRQWKPDRCKRGHEFTPDNTYIHIRDGAERRHCRICSRRRSLDHYRNSKSPQSQG